MKLVKQFIRQNLSLVLGTLFLLLIQLTATLYIPYLVAHIVDDGILANNLNTIYSLGLEMLFVAIIGVIAAVACSYYSSLIATRFGTDLRLQVFKKVQVLSVKDVEDYGTSSLVSRITSDVVNIQQVVVMLFQMILPGPLIGIVCVIMSYMISPTLGLVALMSILVFLGAAIIVTKRAVPYMNAIQYYLDRMILVLREFFVGVRIIRAFDNSEYEQKRTDKTFEDHA
ncbi:ABC transporter ATP-binding protein [Erysipelothrix sp. D19-032]